MTGIVHALLAIGDLDELLSHPVIGMSWEGFVVENVIAAARTRITPYFYRTRRGAEIDLLLVWPGGEQWAIEIKRSVAPRPERGFHHACEDVKPQERFVVYPGDDEYQVAPGITALPLAALAARVEQAA